MGSLKDDILNVQKDMESIRQAVGILSSSLKNCSCGGRSLDNIEESLHNLDTHLYDVLSHITNTTETAAPAVEG